MARIVESYQNASDSLLTLSEKYNNIVRDHKLTNEKLDAFKSFIESNEDEICKLGLENKVCDNIKNYNFEIDDVTLMIADEKNRLAELQRLRLEEERRRREAEEEERRRLEEEAAKRKALIINIIKFALIAVAVIGAVIFISNHIELFLGLVAIAALIAGLAWYAKRKN